MRYKIFLIAIFVLGIILGMAAGVWLSARRVEDKYRAGAGKKAVKVKKPYHPKAAVVMDDFGYNTNNLDALFKIKRPITLSILPNLRYSREIAVSAKSKGYEVILHLPLEPHRKDVREEVDTINSKMDEKEVLARLESGIESVPGLKGVSNHMGSKSTEEKPLMTIIFSDLNKKKLYFLDSLTSERSVCADVARRTGLRYAKRSIFLDNSNAEDYIRKQILEMRRLAFKNGRAIAICHDRKNTVKVLGEMMPELASEGIDFVYLSELVK